MEGRGGEGGGSNQLIYQSFITWEGAGGRGRVGVLDIDLPIFSPEQALKPVPLLSLCFAKQTPSSPYQATFRDFCLCIHLQPLAQAAIWQPLAATCHSSKHCTLSSLCKSCKISSWLALQKFGTYYRKSLGLFHGFSELSSGENRNFFAEQHCRNLGFLQNCVRRNHDILRTEVAVACSHLAATCKWLRVAAKWKIKMRTSCKLNEFSKRGVGWLKA